MVTGTMVPLVIGTMVPVVISYGYRYYGTSSDLIGTMVPMVPVPVVISYYGTYSDVIRSTDLAHGMHCNTPFDIGQHP